MVAVPVTQSARQWQLAHGAAAVDWIRSSGVAEGMLGNICSAVETTIEWEVGDNQSWARRVIERFPAVRENCDHLGFSDPAQALAYLILHVPDRYCRMFQVLERMLVNGALPIGKSDRFAAIDIGAGPGPGIFAVRSFYAALACYTRLHDPAWRVTPLGRADIVEYSQAMPRVMGRFGQALLMTERNQLSGADPSAPPPCAEELARSALPPSQVYRDFSVFDVHHEHHQARLVRAEELYREDDAALSREGARRLAYAEAADRPSGYAVASMMNFLTPGSRALSRFSDAIERLVGNALIPGGTALVLGGVGPDYQEIYQELDQRARNAGLTVLDGFDTRLPATQWDRERDLVVAVIRRMWGKLESLAGDVSQTKAKLPAKIFDVSKPYPLSKFRARAYRRGV